MLSGITITCFTASYAVALVLEVIRARVRSVWWSGTAIGFLIAGLFAHSIYLLNLASDELGQIVLFSRWYDWCLLAAWILAAACLGLSLRKVPLIGIFMLPLVLALSGAASLLRSSPPFERSDAIRYWGMIHGVTLLIGTVGVTIGFVAGLMFLLQSYRLKNKIPPSKTFKLPSLEWLQRLNEELLLISSFFLALGLLTGVVMKDIQRASVVDWTEPTVLSSAVLLVWLIAALLLNWLYKPARRGQKVAYLTMANFGLVAIVLTLVLLSRHAASVESVQAGRADVSAFEQRGRGSRRADAVAKSPVSSAQQELRPPGTAANASWRLSP